MGATGVAAEAKLTLAINETVTIYTAFADNALGNSNLAGAASVTAAASLAAANAAASGIAAAVDRAKQQWWSAFWKASAVSLPQSPAVERYWYNANYISASMASTNSQLPPPGLFGPWTSQDNPAWGGDYTLVSDRKFPLS